MGVNTSARRLIDSVAQMAFELGEGEAVARGQASLPVETFDQSPAEPLKTVHQGPSY